MPLGSNEFTITRRVLRRHLQVKLMRASLNLTLKLHCWMQMRLRRVALGALVSPSRARGMTV
jgi:hypothetical protein